MVRVGKSKLLDIVDALFEYKIISHPTYVATQQCVANTRRQIENIRAVGLPNADSSIKEHMYRMEETIKKIIRSNTIEVVYETAEAAPPLIITPPPPAIAAPPPPASHVELKISQQLRAELDAMKDIMALFISNKTITDAYVKIIDTKQYGVCSGIGLATALNDINRKYDTILNVLERARRTFGVDDSGNFFDIGSKKYIDILPLWRRENLVAKCLEPLENKFLASFDLKQIENDINDINIPVDWDQDVKITYATEILSMYSYKIFKELKTEIDREMYVYCEPLRNMLDEIRDIEGKNIILGMIVDSGFDQIMNKYQQIFAYARAIDLLNNCKKNDNTDLNAGEISVLLNQYTLPFAEKKLIENEFKKKSCFWAK